MDKVAKWKRLDELALQDERYMNYYRTYCEAAAKFDRIIRWCPPPLRLILEEYADSGRLMMQRMAGIALENMEFTNE